MLSTYINEGLETLISTNPLDDSQANPTTLKHSIPQSTDYMRHGRSGKVRFKIQFREKKQNLKGNFSNLQIKSSN